VIDPVSVTRIVIAGEHPIFRHGLRRLIEAEPGFCIISEIGEGTGAVSLVRELAPDILLLGLTQANGTALAIIRELSADSASTRTIVLTNRVDSPDVMAAVQLGARGVVPKDSAPDLLAWPRATLGGRDESEKIRGGAAANEGVWLDPP
jgi:two-component system nitrate/nitrite response regulator NarL